MLEWIHKICNDIFGKRRLTGLHNRKFRDRIPTWTPRAPCVCCQHMWHTATKTFPRSVALPKACKPWFEFRLPRVGWKFQDPGFCWMPQRWSCVKYLVGFKYPDWVVSKDEDFHKFLVKEYMMMEIIDDSMMIPNVNFWNAARPDPGQFFWYWQRYLRHCCGQMLKDVFFLGGTRTVVFSGWKTVGFYGCWYIDSWCLVSHHQLFKYFLHLFAMFFCCVSRSSVYLHLFFLRVCF